MLLFDLTFVARFGATVGVFHSHCVCTRWQGHLHQACVSCNRGIFLRLSIRAVRLMTRGAAAFESAHGLFFIVLCSSVGFPCVCCHLPTRPHTILRSLWLAQSMGRAMSGVGVADDNTNALSTWFLSPWLFSAVFGVFRFSGVRCQSC